MAKKLLIILDPAHGEETAGKRSPDGKHREYYWSRRQLIKIEAALWSLGYKVEWTNKGDTEIGLQKRQQIASQYVKENPDLVPFLISLHNDAVNATPQWQSKASGISVWTSKGRTQSDIFADFFIQNIDKHLPGVKKRISSHEYLDRDFESNFTVLMGNYSAILIECMFQDNKEDVEKLDDPVFCRKVVDWIIGSIEECNDYIVQKTNR